MPRGRRSHASQPVAASSAELSLPDKLYFRIGEVSELTGSKPYVLRYWETEFPMLKPVKTRSGHRLYRRGDVETILEIKRLLYDEGFTIEGARKQLAGNLQGSTGRESAAKPAVDGMHLRAIKRELQQILTILSRKC